MCTLPKPPAGRALSEGKEAPQAAFPSWGFPSQTKRRTEGIRVPVPLAWGGSSTARVLLRLCPESACQTVSRRILKEGESAVKDYLGFLSGGCSKSPIDLLKGAGVDMTGPEPVNQALQLFDELLDEMEALMQE